MVGRRAGARKPAKRARKTTAMRSGRKRVVEAAEPTPKRRPGRPRKVQAHPDAAPKRKPGRPRAVQAATNPLPKRKPGRPSTTDELRRELAGLRAAFSEAVEQLSVRVGARIAEIDRVLEARPKGGQTGLDNRKLRKMAQAIRSTKLRPGKGRLKDLVRVSKLLEALLAGLPEES